MSRRWPKRATARCCRRGPHLRVGALELIRGRPDAAATHARAAETIARSIDDDALLTLTLASVGYVEMQRGGGIVAETRDAIEIERTLEASTATDMLSGARGMILASMTLTYGGALDEARSLLNVVLDRLTAAGNELGRAGVLFHLAEVERRAGNWDDALVLSDRSRGLLAQTGPDYAASPVVGVLLDAGMGRLDDARRDALDGLDTARRRGDRQLELYNRGALGFVELCAGDSAAAAAWLSPATDLLFELEIGELALHPVVNNEVEAAIAAGQLERAEYVVARVEELAVSTGRPWARMIAARGRGQLLAAGGDLEGARAALGAAMETNPEIGEPFEFARTLFAVGIAERRSKRKRAAREALLRAAEIFAALPAPAWEARARDEIKRLGLRTAGQRADRDRGADRRTGRGRAHEPGDRGRGLPEPQDGRGQPVADLPQARGPITDRAGARIRGTAGGPGPHGLMGWAVGRTMRRRPN